MFIVESTCTIQYDYRHPYVGTMIKQIMIKLLILSIFIKFVLSEGKYRVIATALYYTSDNGKVLLATGSLPIDAQKTILNDVQQRFGTGLPISVVSLYKSAQDVPTKQPIFTLLRKEFPSVYIADIPQSKSRKIMRDLRKHMGDNPLLTYIQSQIKNSPLPRTIEKPGTKTQGFDLNQYLTLARNMNLSSLSEGNYSSVGATRQDKKAPDSETVNGTASGAGGNKEDKASDAKGTKESSDKKPAVIVKKPRIGEKKTERTDQETSDGKGPRDSDKGPVTTSSATTVGVDSAKGSQSVVKEPGSDDSKLRLHDGGTEGDATEPKHSEEVEKPGEHPDVKPLNDDTTKKHKEGRPPYIRPIPTTEEIVPNDIYYGIELTCANWNNLCDDRGPKDLRDIPAPYLNVPMLHIKMPRYMYQLA